MPEWMVWISQPESWMALLTLTFLEVVLGIDNIIFISILVEKLPASQRDRGRVLGLAFAMISRILLLLTISWVMKLTTELFHLPFFEHGTSGKDIILILGGLFLLVKSTHEIHHKIEEIDDRDEEHQQAKEKRKKSASFGSVLFQIALLDIIFSLDSVITAVGMAEEVPVMIIAVVIAVLFMMWFSGPVASFINKYPSLQMLALSFLILIGFTLIADGFHFHIPKGYIYFAMVFSFFVELLNLRVNQGPIRNMILGSEES